MPMRKFIYACCWVMIGLVSSCVPEMPITSEIIIDGNLPTTPVNAMLYGVTLEEAHHAIDGGLYAELILNRSFEEGQLPLFCRYDRASNRLITPNGWAMPFVRPDSIPGWIKTTHAYLSLNSQEPINDVNKQYLTVYNSGGGGRGGVLATGYQGIPLKKGEKYDLYFFLKGSSFQQKTLYVCLEDSSRQKTYSEVFTTPITNNWKFTKHTFTASDSTNCAILSFTTDSATVFSLDDVSLFSQSSLANNRLREDLFESIQALHPSFVRFPGGKHVEGYTQGTYPIWHETMGESRKRKQFFSINGYTTTNGLGFHEYLVLCEQLKAEPVYVVNAGITNQDRRPRYEDITKMKFLVEDLLNAIAYANQPADSTYGAQRARNGHPEPFNLKYVQIGSENKGFEYRRRFLLFYEALKEKHPEITIIGNDAFERRGMSYLLDHHYYADPLFFLTNTSRFHPDHYPRRAPRAMINEFGVIDKQQEGSMQAALAEATFLTGIENTPTNVAGIAYSPLLVNADFHNEHALIRFKTQQRVLSPSYYAFQLFTENQGHEVIKTTTKSYQKPFVESGAILLRTTDNFYSVRDIQLNGSPLPDVIHPKFTEQVTLDSNPQTNVTFRAQVKRDKGYGSIQFRFRHNTFDQGERFIGVDISNDGCELFMQHNELKDTLAADHAFVLENEQTYPLELTINNDSITCKLGSRPVLQGKLPAIPSLVTTASVDTLQQVLILKVVNNTYHEERTHIQFKGLHTDNDILVKQLKGEPEDRNTFERPDYILPEEKKYSFSIQRPNVYIFPPQSITILRVPLND